MDSTSLTRTLRIMRGAGWIAERRGADRRERLWRLSKAGETKLKAATPAWDALQRRVREKVGEDGWQSLMRATNEITGAAVDLIAEKGGSI
ncbi:MAG TPA: MarR family winged helix-turn-helix transcriptional regulator [Candidatus Acidoferrales bacterium]